MRVADAEENAPATDVELVLPWWYSWWRVALVAAAATLVIGGLIGLAVRSQQPGEGSVDAGFLQDMRAHHDQAVQMSLVYLDRPGTDSLLRTMATEIVVGQNVEVGMMVEILRRMNLAEENPSDEAMEWMGMGVPADRMPGMATPEEIDQLLGSDGRAADELFVRLMTAHHEGGIHMADYAADRAKEGRVRELATAMARNQRSEIDEMATALARVPTPA